MKGKLLFAALVLSFSCLAQVNVKIVFDVTSGDEDIHRSTLRHVMGMAEAYPESQFEVVVYSSALDMVLKENSSVRKEIEKLADNKNVTFKVCAMSMKRHKVDNAMLIKGVEPVPDGIVEIIEKQKQGWGYIKEAN